MEYEYSIGFQTLEMRPGLADASAAEVNDALSREVGNTVRDLAEALPTLVGGGWEIISHGITSLDGRLVVSFLTRRPKGVTPHS
jgi:hypothetical protein